MDSNTQISINETDSEMACITLHRLTNVDAPSLSVSLGGSLPLKRVGTKRLPFKSSKELYAGASFQT